MANTVAKTDAEGKYDDIRIHLTDLDCEGCGNRWFQLQPREDADDMSVGDAEGEAVIVVCCGCGETLSHPAHDYGDDED